MSDTGMQTGMSQRMAATASMQLGVRVLQANGMELSQIVHQALESNPVLELESSGDYVELAESGKEGDDGDREGNGWEEYLNHDSFSPASQAGRDYFFDSLTEHETLAASLHRQAHVAALPADVTATLDLLIDSLDGRGFFEEPPSRIAEREGIPDRVMKEALAALREMEPSGVGAMDLRDCLLIQLANAREGDTLAARLVRDCWDDVVRHRYELAASRLGVPLGEISEAMGRITRLNPDPGSEFAHVEQLDVTPDIIVEQEKDGSFEVRLAESHVPHLKLSSYYKDALSERFDDAELRHYLKKSFREGRELIDAIAQRQETILRVARSIVERQDDYFNKGPGFLKAMSMTAIADELGLHVSTVSRAVAGKYLWCRWGIRELRSFFTSSIPVAGGEEESGMSSSAVQEMIRAIIDAEDKRKPLSDAAITSRLEEKGLKIARRTVAKYREQLKILPASMRKVV